MSWDSGRPIYQRLPGNNGGYSANDPADWLTQWADDELMETKADLETEVNRQYNPVNTDANRLDYLSQLTGFTGGYWERAYTEGQKRLLIQSALSLIWPRRGFTESISRFLGILEILHILREGGSFILGESVLGDVLGFVGWQFVIILPNRYFGTPIEKAVIKAVEQLTPCWCSSQIVYDDSYYSPIEILALDDESSIYSAPDSVIKVS